MKRLKKPNTGPVHPRNRAKIKEDKKKFTEDCEQHLVRVLAGESKGVALLTQFFLLAKVDERVELLKRTYPNRVAAILLAAQNVKKAIEKLVHERKLT